MNDFHILSTLGTGTFGRVRLVKHRSDPKDGEPQALKCLKKSAVIKLVNLISLRRGVHLGQIGYLPSDTITAVISNLATLNFCGISNQSPLSYL